MTVGTKPDVAEVHLPLEQIKEVTGITDSSKILNVWKNCAAKGGTVQDITTDVISSLLGPEGPPVATTSRNDYTATMLNNKSLASLPSPEPRVRSNSMETQVEPDLTYPKPVSDQSTGDGDSDDMRKAIAASLEGQGPVPSMLGGQITREDQDISRVLEQSLADTKSADGRKNAVWFFDQANPYERRREGSWPVGLKNVGNTCWFNAVIQSLFHIETFRECVINYEPTEALSKDNHISVFMVELGRLFALMLASDRKYLNPTAVIEILKQSFVSNSEGQSVQTSNDQQDVSEFQHKLLDWLEEAFQYKAGITHNEDKPTVDGAKPQAMEVDESTQEKNESNEMVKLFYGKVKTFGFNAGVAFTTHTHFGQWPLYVAGYSDIHESLEAGLAKGDIETNNTEHTSNQEQWFTRLPPLLTFELSRFSYNTMQSQAEKLHNKFSFPQTLFLDRYLEVNKEEVREKRGRLWKLSSELISRQAKLHKYTHYGDEGDQYPLHDILNYSLKFATSAHSSASSHSFNLSAQSSPKPSHVESEPQPKNVSAEELAVLTRCLRRWKNEVNAEIAQYEQDIAGLKHDISQTYEQEHLKQHKYCLHAVMVHEGEAISGHYWSYIYNRQTSLWLKFNDVCVMESSWEEVVKESEGGYGKASAYCLIYIQCTDTSNQSASGFTSVQTPAGEDFPSKEDALAKLRADLQSYAIRDNEDLLQELQQWDLSKSVIRTEHSGATSTPDIVSGMDIEPGHTRLEGSISTEVDDLANSHAQPILTMMRSKLTEIVKSFGTTITWSFKLELLVNQCYDRCTTHSKDLKQRSKLDTRAHFVVYLLMVYGSSILPKDVKTLIADQITRLPHNSDISGWNHVQQEAIQVASKYWEKSPEFQLDYVKWHQEFHLFRIVLSLFVEGVTFYTLERYEEALPYLHDAFVRNLQLIESATTVSPKGSNFAMKYLDKTLLSELKNECLKKFNEMALAQFENEDDYTTPLKVMLTHVLPILDTMQMEGASTVDTDVVGSIRDRWVNLLIDESMEEHRMESLKEFIGQLFEASVSPAPTIDDVQLPVDLRSRCKQAMIKYYNLTN